MRHYEVSNDHWRVKSALMPKTIDYDLFCLFYCQPEFRLNFNRISRHKYTNVHTFNCHFLWLNTIIEKKVEIKNVKNRGKLLVWFGMWQAYMKMTTAEGSKLHQFQFNWISITINSPKRVYCGKDNILRVFCVYIHVCSHMSRFW